VTPSLEPLFARLEPTTRQLRRHLDKLLTRTHGVQVLNVQVAGPRPAASPSGCSRVCGCSIQTASSLGEVIRRKYGGGIT
jgi:hypothetical protein